MATLVSAHKLSKAQGGRTLFENITFGIEEKAKVALIGPNGAGKSTLFRILAGQVDADGGTLSFAKHCRIAYLDQDPRFDPEHTLLETVLQDLSSSEQEDSSCQARAFELLSRMGFDTAGIDATQKTRSLSGGWAKKAALARVVMTQPNLLLLDEPTNHLDVESILWLEDFLNSANFAVLSITHDRAFLQNTSDTIIELNRCYASGFLKIDDDYAKFCEIKSAILAGQEQSEDAANNRLRRELEWLKRGPKARTTKQKARIKQSEELEEVVSKMEYRSRITPVRIEFKAHEKTPKKLIEAKQVSKAFGEHVVFKDFDLLVERKSRIALLGANGSGKSTLLKVLMGESSCDSGSVQRTDLLELSYLSQDKDLGREEGELLHFFSKGGNKINFCGQWVDPRSYLARFGFHSDQLSTDVSLLSGGERARLLMAELMLKPSNLLVLDEPTNDLDLNTLNILEEQLENYDGALLLVSHDRYFLDNVCNEIYAFSPHPDHKSLERFADVHQWERWHKQEVKRALKDAKKVSGNAPSPTTELTPKTTKKKALSYKEKYELENMEPRILEKEALMEKLTGDLQDCDPKDAASISQQLAALQSEIDGLYERWDELTQG